MIFSYQNLYNLPAEHTALEWRYFPCILIIPQDPVFGTDFAQRLLKIAYYFLIPIFVLLHFRRYGVGYHLTLVKNSDFNEMGTDKIIVDAVPTAKMASNGQSEISYLLEHEHSKKFRDLFEKLEGMFSYQIDLFVQFFSGNDKLFIYF